MKSFRKLVLFLIAFDIIGATVSAETIREKELKRMELNKQYDRYKLREKNDFVTDSSIDFFVEPEPKAFDRNFIVANVPPTVKMRIIPNMEPEYFTDVTDRKKVYLVGWANWGRMTRSNDNRFYFVVSDHRAYGCHMNLYEYITSRNIVHKVLDIHKLLGWTEKSYTDGKMHGHMGILHDGTLWGATHYGVYPDSSWWADGYRGSWLFSYNIYTHKATNWGVPLVGNMLPCYMVDTVRGRFVGTGPNNTIFCWDCINKKVTYAGYPPNGWVWWRRGILCDMKTGKFWTTDNSDGKHRFMSFDPELNRFERYEVSPPPNPHTKNVNSLRGYTDYPAVDGWYYCCTKSESGPPGRAFFRFKPEGKSGPEVESLGVNWGKGIDTLQMVLSPKGRYVYYFPGDYTAPLVQYDVKTGTKKALCWLSDYYHSKYGYAVGHSFGMEISTDGSFLVVCMNGTFQDYKKSGYGHPSLFIIQIPKTERTE